jgi:hypothetical protein
MVEQKPQNKSGGKIFFHQKNDNASFSAQTGASDLHQAAPTKTGSVRGHPSYLYPKSTNPTAMTSAANPSSKT